MRYGAHLPLIHLDGSGWRSGELAGFTDAARDLGFDFITANDHLLYPIPWLDGIVALASVLERSAGMRLATTVALPVVRGPIALAKAAAALDILSDGRLVLGVGPGSSERDYQAVGVRFDERWPRLEESLQVLRTHLTPEPRRGAANFYTSEAVLEPRPVQADGPPIWIGSWGSDAGLRRVARWGDGWIASAYNLTPAQAGAARARLGEALARRKRTLDDFPCALATMWTYITDDDTTRDGHLAALADVLHRPVADLREQVLVGPADHCAAILRGYAEAGMDTVFIWPLADAEHQLERFMRDVAPLV
jgi:alkanesulfonate monooxygenase SsuD/methylene tetrahydromethanopterin reductase-like flavin-dependent oxidoreductase (luciferase family)